MVLWFQRLSNPECSIDHVRPATFPIFMRDNDRTRAARLLTRIAKRALLKLPRDRHGRPIPGNATIEFSLLPHREMERLQRAYLPRRLARGRQNAHHFPNVLSFPTPKGFPHPPRIRPLLGEVYVNERVVRDEGVPRAAYFLIHGILHCAGYRHVRNRDMLQMERIEKRLMRHLFPPQRSR